MSFLNGIGFPLLTAYLVIAIALIQINLQLGEDQMPTSVEGITVFLLAILLFLLFVIGIVTAPISRLQKRIIKGELKHHSEILEVYIEEIENQGLLSTIKNEIIRAIKPPEKK